jgi:hypothetical protein
MVVTETIAGLSAVKTAFDMAKALQGIHDAAARDRAVIYLQKEILSAQAAQFELMERVRNLEANLATLEAQRSQMRRYQLKDFGGNTFAYELKDAEANGEPIHRACSTCYQKGNISVLQFSHHESGQDWYECPACEDRRAYGTRIKRDMNPNRYTSDF